MIFKYVQNPIFITFLINHVIVVFEVLMAATMKMAVFWDVTLCSVEHATSITRVDFSLVGGLVGCC
jgi:hypothetical protein